MTSTRPAAWTRRGCSLLWCPNTLAEFAKPLEVVPLRAFLGMARAWPEELPSNDGRTVVVAGLEGCLDALSADDAAEWVTHDLKARIFSFQDEYQGDAALVFWMPSGRARIRYQLASGEYSWASHGGAILPIGRLLWAGAQGDAERILVGPPSADPDGEAWVGMYHPRIS